MWSIKITEKKLRECIVVIAVVKKTHYDNLGS